MKVEKQLDFKNAGTIFRECCKRNGEEQNYTYTSSEDNSNKLFRINYRHKLGNVRDIKQTNINYDTEIQIKDEFQIELFDLIFTTPEYFPKIKILWDNLLEDTG